MLPHEEVVIEGGVLDRIRPIGGFVAVDGDGVSGLRAQGTTDRVRKIYGKRLRNFTKRVINDEDPDRSRRKTLISPSRSEALLILTGRDEGLNHFRVNEVPTEIL